MIVGGGMAGLATAAYLAPRGTGPSAPVGCPRRSYRGGTQAGSSPAGNRGPGQVADPSTSRGFETSIAPGYDKWKAIFLTHSLDGLALKSYNDHEVCKMAEKISVYVDEELHRALKAAASLQGQSLSEFMVEAALRALHTPDRKLASSKMDRIRASLKGTVSVEELRDMRNEGRRR